MSSEAIIKTLNMNSIFMLNCNRQTSNDVILASRVNQALCDEAEAGRAHGGTSIDGDYLKIDGNWIRINLNSAYRLDWGFYCPGYPFDFFPGGEPLIEDRNVDFLGMHPPLNGQVPWNTQNIYLRASVYSTSIFIQPDVLGFYFTEYQQAEALGGAWGLSGNVGDKNRINEGNWHDDDSLLTTQGDSSGVTFLVRDAMNQPQYLIELLPIPKGTLLLPYRYLKRKGYIGPRRVFFAPEKDIEIWGAFQIAQPHITDVILCYDPGMMFLNYPENVAVGCIPGGASAVYKSNFAPFRGKRVLLTLFNTLDKEEVNYVIKCFAQLRKNLISVICLKVDGTQILGDYNLQGKNFMGSWFTNFKTEKLTIEQLRKFADQLNIFTPEEFSSDYLGDITERVNAHEAVPVITGLFNSDDIVFLDTQDEPIGPMLIALFARTLNTGTAIFPGLWANGHFASVVFVDHPTDMVAGYLRNSGVHIGDSRFIDALPEERLNVFQAVVGTAQVVFFAGYEVWAQPTVFLDAIRWCRRNRKAVIIMPTDDSALLKKVRHMTSKVISVRRIDGDNEITVSITASGITSIAASFASNGDFLSAKALSTDQEGQVVNHHVIPSMPYDTNRFKDLAELPPEKKLAAIAEQKKLTEVNLLESIEQGE